MRLQFIIIIIALSVTIAGTSVWPWESIVCTLNSTCVDNTSNITNASCNFSGMTERLNVPTIHRSSNNGTSDEPIELTISPNELFELISPNKTCSAFTTITTKIASVIYTYSNDSCQGPNSALITLAELTDCGGKGILCWVLIGLGCIITLLVAVILVLCLVVTCLLVRGKRYQYTPNVVLTQSSTDRNQIQEEQLPPPENQDSGTQQPNLYHVLDPQYDSVDNKTTKPTVTAEPVQYCEPSIHVKAEVMEQKGPTGSGAQSSKPKASLEKIDEQDTGAFYDELTGPGYPKSLKSSEHSATSLPTTAQPRYSSLHVEKATEKEQQEELIALYSMPDKSKKKEKDGGKKTRETELTMSPISMVRSPTENRPPFTTDRKRSGQGGEIGLAKPPKTPSPPPPLLPPKPGQTSMMAEGIQEEELEDEEESAYAEVSSRPIGSSQSRNRTPAGAIGMTVSPLHLMSQDLSSTSDTEKGRFRRSYSMEGYFGSEVLRHQKASDMDFHQLYDPPKNPSLHTRGMSPHQERQEEEEEERQGFFRAS